MSGNKPKNFTLTWKCRFCGDAFTTEDTANETLESYTHAATRGYLVGINDHSPGRVLPLCKEHQCYSNGNAVGIGELIGISEDPSHES